MHYSVLGTGAVGRIIAAKLAQLGHTVTIGSRDRAATLARNTPDARGNQPFAQWLATVDSIEIDSFAVAATQGERVINATSGSATLAVLSAAGSAAFADKILIDIANPLDFSNGMPPTLSPVNTDSLGEQVQRALPAARVVKTLNTVSDHIMTNPSLVDGDHHVFLSGNDQGAKNEVTDLLEEFGWPRDSALDLGDITTARATEMLLPMWFRLGAARGHRNMNFHIAGA
ncbi:MAG: NADPH-dependent F420 reductase [Rhodoglobus sp.]